MSAGGMMKNLQNYAKNVQLVKRNIILCVASFYIASFPLDLDYSVSGGLVERYDDVGKAKTSEKRWA